jgi:hypothetical protein
MNSCTEYLCKIITIEDFQSHFYSNKEFIDMGFLMKTDKILLGGILHTVAGCHDNL